jgi:hypothetical protein
MGNIYKQENLSLGLEIYIAGIKIIFKIISYNHEWLFYDDVGRRFIYEIATDIIKDL